MPGAARRSLTMRSLAASAALMLIAGCASGPERSTGAFCERLRAEQPHLEGPLATPEDVQRLVELYRDLAALAPLAIQEEWDRITALVEAAASVDLGDPAAVDALREQAYATERAARDVSAWVADRCGITLPVGGVLPSG